MKTKAEITSNWLERYTGTQIKNFGKYILLTNFNKYLDIFAQAQGVEKLGANKAMPNATS